MSVISAVQFCSWLLQFPVSFRSKTLVIFAVIERHQLSETSSSRNVQAVPHAAPRTYFYTYALHRQLDVIHQRRRRKKPPKRILLTVNSERRGPLEKRRGAQPAARYRWRRRQTKMESEGVCGVVFLAFASSSLLESCLGASLKKPTTSVDSNQSFQILH